MTPEPFLIAHLVRGEPAFDIAIKMPCPCEHEQGCDECDTTGHWWIIPTSGHRARPYWNWELRRATTNDEGPLIDEVPPPPPGWPDHYPATATPKGPSFLDRIKAALAPKVEPIKRRV